MSDNSEEQIFVGDRLVADLKVVELRKELEVRSLPKSGNKKELIERLQNFLREENAEHVRKEQVQQPSIQNKSPSKSPTASGSMPNVVAQYLAQQQIQLEEARRKADKSRASTSSEHSAMVQEAASPIQGEEIQQQAEHTEMAKKEDLAQPQNTEFIPEEPTLNIPKTTTDKAPIVENQRMEETGESGHGQEESESETEEMEMEKSYENERQMESPTENDENEQSEEIETREEGSRETEKYDEQATEPVQDDDDINRMDEEEKQTTDYGQAAVTQSSEFVPQEPGASKDFDKSSKEEAVKEVFDPENDEDGEYHEEPADDAGKRRNRQSPPMLADGRSEQPTMVEGRRADEVGISAVAQAADSSSAQEVSNEPPAVTVLNSVAQMLASIQEESSKPVMEQETTTPDGFVRRRAASPARNPPSRWVHIRNLKRPFTKAALLDLLGKFGTVDQSQFWIDSIKSNCIITYESMEQAQLARGRLHNVVWPPASDMALCVEYSSDEKLRRRKAEEQREAEANNSSLGGLGLTIVVDNRSQGIAPTDSGPTVLIQHDKEQQKIVENRKRKAEELENSQKTLDELFKKTKTLPCIYYLPLTDAEAAKRPKRSSSSTKHQHGGASSSGSNRHRHTSGSSARHHHSTGSSSRRSGVHSTSRR